MLGLHIQITVQIKYLWEEAPEISILQKSLLESQKSCQGRIHSGLWRKTLTFNKTEEKGSAVSTLAYIC